MRRSYPFVLAIGLILLIGPGGDHLQSGSLDAYRQVLSGMRLDPVHRVAKAATADRAVPPQGVAASSPEHTDVRALDASAPRPDHGGHRSRGSALVHAGTPASRNAADGIATLPISLPDRRGDSVVAGGGETGGCVVGIGHEQGNE